MSTSASLLEFATSVVRKLVDARHRAVFAGGCVRDMLLGTEPKDYDVATSAKPEEVMKLFRRTIPVGVAFGVVRVLDKGEHPLAVEVATFRGESGYADGRHPTEVHFTNEIEDVKRRDFTVNGLLFDPLKDEVLDYVGGREDLSRKLLRAIGDPAQRFAEDHLRMLRAVRFAAQLGFEIEPATFAAVKANVANIHSISAERVRDELNRMLSGPNPRRAFELLKSSGLLREILPEVDAMAGVQQPPQFHPEGDVWTHTLMLLGQLSNAPLSVALGALFHDVGKPPTFTVTDRIRFNEHEKVGAELTQTIMRRLKYANEEIERVVALVKGHMMFKDTEHMRPSTLKKFLRQPHFEDHLALHKLDCMASHGSLDAYEFCRARLGQESEETLRPPPLITGQDLIALGLQPGPKFKQILQEVEDRQLEGALTDKEAALAFVREWLKSHP
ncbi:MAG TPA: CCA tRNA nucleotidyltransferase [Planctomycetota bacterium]|nr:CCA tRNA nucleotidyltransferase [Planctomycetota bacterium]